MEPLRTTQTTSLTPTQRSRNARRRNERIIYDPHADPRTPGQRLGERIDLLRTNRAAWAGQSAEIYEADDEFDVWR